MFKPLGGSDICTFFAKAGASLLRFVKREMSGCLSFFLGRGLGGRFVDLRIGFDRARLTSLLREAADRRGCRLGDGVSPTASLAVSAVKWVKPAGDLAEGRSAEAFAPSERGKR